MSKGVYKLLELQADLVRENLPSGEVVWSRMENGNGYTVRALVALSGFRPGTVRIALKKMIDDGKIKQFVHGSTREIIYFKEVDNASAVVGRGGLAGRRRP
jgi:hypothetical protein